MTVRGVEAIKFYWPPSNDRINPNVEEEKAIETSETIMTSVERYK